MFFLVLIFRRKNATEKERIKKKQTHVEFNGGKIGLNDKKIAYNLTLCGKD